MFECKNIIILHRNKQFKINFNPNKQNKKSDTLRIALFKAKSGNLW